MSIFNNESILAWLKYFSDHSEIDLSTVRILDITGGEPEPAAHGAGQPLCAGVHRREPPGDFLQHVGRGHGGL